MLLVLGLPVIGSTLFYGSDPMDDLSVQVHSVQAILAERLESSGEISIPTLAHHLVTLCQLYRLDPAFVLSMIQVESDFRVDAVSPMGAVGLMQLMPATAQVMMKEMHFRPAGYSKRGVQKVLMDPFTNLSLGVAYLAFLRDHYQAQPIFFRIAAYNLGPARTDELLSKRDFKPVITKKYYEAVQRGFYQFRSYFPKGPRV
jgi:soluble lytic murein transglycosylase-like protein